jgi:uncharacterized repeat protein (TIGR01451 family)
VAERPDRRAVYLFHRDPLATGGWSLLPPVLVGMAGDWFGFDVAIDGATLLVGAPRARDGSGVQTGAAYSFDLSGLGHGGQVVARGPLPIAGGREGDEIGSAVAASGNRWAVGARSDGRAGAGAGSVYVCCRQGQVEKLLPDAPADGAHFGQAASLDGGILAVGAPFTQVGGALAGAAYVFEDRPNGWQRTRLPAAVRTGAAFGYAVALSAAAAEVVVGAPLEDGPGIAAGAAYLYRRNPDGTWPQQALRLDAGQEAATGAQFGVAVSVDRGAQHEIVAGARGAHGGDEGAAYLFDADGRALLVLSSPQVQAGAEFGFEAALRDGTLLVGAFLQDGGAGAAYLFAPVPAPVPCVSLTKTDERTTASPGDVLTYRIHVLNCGAATKTVTVSDPFVETGLLNGRWCLGARCGEGNLRDTVTLAAGAAALYTVTGTAPCGPGPGPSNLVNRACATVAGQPPVCQADADSIAPPTADLAITGSATPAVVIAGEPISYHWVVQNLGPCPAQDVVLEQQLPFEPVNLVTAGAGPGRAKVLCAVSFGALTCHLGTLAPDGPVPVDLQLRVPCDLPAGTLFATATVTSVTPDVTPDLPAGDNSATVRTPVEVVADYSVVKCCPPVKVAGETIDYTLTVRNLGPSCPPAALTDVLPPQVQCALWCRGATCTPDVHGNIPSCPISLLPGGVEEFSLKGTIDGAFSRGPSVDVPQVLTNTASIAVASGSDPVPENNSSTCTTQVQPPPQSIPALSGGALAGFALLLAALAVARLAAARPRGSSGAQGRSSRPS